MSPSSTRSITAAAVIGFVSDAIRTIESEPTSPALPISTSSPRATSAAAPGTMPRPTAAWSKLWRAVIAGTDTTGSQRDEGAE
jgi:hypothetical protein